MSWLGNFFNGASQLGNFAKSAVSQLGNLRDSVSHGFKTAGDIAGQVGTALNDNSGKLDAVGLGGVARYAGNALNNGGQLSNAIGNFVGSNSINDAVNNGTDVITRGYNFGKALTGATPAKSPLTS